MGARLAPSKVALRMALTVLREFCFVVATSSSCRGQGELGAFLFMHAHVCEIKILGPSSREYSDRWAHVTGCASKLTVTHVLHHSRSDISRQEWTMRTLVSFLKATLLPEGGSDACWDRLECSPRDEEDREDAPDDRRRRGGSGGGGTTGAWGAAAAAAGRSTTELLGPPLTGRLAPLFRRIMAL